MASPPSISRRTDIDLRAMWRQVVGAVRGAQRWPLFKRLTPDVPVLVLRADGSEAVWLGESARAGKTSARRASAFVAVELIDDIVLRRRILVPAMQDADIMSAAELDARGASPFPASDLVWGFSRRQHASGAVEVDIAMASRKQVERYLAERATALAGLPPPEVWAVSGHGAPIVFAGFGEGRRTSNAASWRRIGYGLLATAALLLAAMALTPVAQFRMRWIEAATAFQSLQTQSASVVQRREALVKTSAKLTTLSTLLTESVDPLAAMEFLTRVLPDDTSLLTLQIQGSKVNITGFTNDAAQLMQNLSKQEGLRDVKTPGLAMRPPNATKDNFNIEFVMVPKAVEAPAASATPGAQAAVGALTQPVVAPASPQPTPAAPAAVGAAPAAVPAPAPAATAAAAAVPPVAAGGPPTGSARQVPTTTKPIGPVFGGGAVRSIAPAKAAEPPAEAAP